MPRFVPISAVVAAVLFCGTHASSMPNIYVGGSQVYIPSGSSTTSVDNGTYMGNIYYAGSINTLPYVPFQIWNGGTQPLLISLPASYTFSGPHGADFGASYSDFNSTIQPGGVYRFHIHCHPSAPGVRATTISIPSNDPDTPTYTFNLTANGVNAHPPVRNDFSVLRLEFLKVKPKKIKKQDQLKVKVRADIYSRFLFPDGQTKAKPGNIRFVLSNDPFVSMNDQFFEPRKFRKKIRPAGSAGKKFKLVLPPDAANKYLLALIDADEEIDEHSEYNNWFGERVPPPQ